MLTKPMTDSDQVFTLANLGLADDVADSESLLALEDGWDGAGSPGYAEPTWQRAILLLVDIASNLRDVHQLRLSAVEIRPGSYGNIDVETRTANRRLMFSVPADQDSPARYYGHDDSRRNTTKGRARSPIRLSVAVGWLAGEYGGGRLPVGAVRQIGEHTSFQVGTQ